MKNSKISNEIEKSVQVSAWMGEGREWSLLRLTQFKKRIVETKKSSIFCFYDNNTDNISDLYRIRALRYFLSSERVKKTIFVHIKIVRFPPWKKSIRPIPDC